MRIRSRHGRSLAADREPRDKIVPAALADCLLAGFLFVAFEFADRFYPAYVSTAPHLVWAGVGAVMTLSVALRRRHPLGVWVVTIAGAALLLGFIAQLDPFASVNGWPSSPLVVLPAPLVSLYTLVSANQARGRLAFAGSAIVLGLMLFGPFPAWRPVHVYALWSTEAERPPLAPGGPGPGLRQPR